MKKIYHLLLLLCWLSTYHSLLFSMTKNYSMEMKDGTLLLEENDFSLLKHASPVLSNMINQTEEELSNIYPIPDINMQELNAIILLLRLLQEKTEQATLAIEEHILQALQENTLPALIQAIDFLNIEPLDVTIAHVIADRILDALTATLYDLPEPTKQNLSYLLDEITDLYGWMPIELQNLVAEFMTSQTGTNKLINISCISLQDSKNPADSNIKILPDTLLTMLLNFNQHMTKLAAISYNNTAKIWDTQTGKLLHILRGHTAPVKAVRFSNDSSLLATASEDSTVNIWDTQSGNLLATIDNNGQSADIIAFSPHDNLLAISLPDSNIIKIWDVNQKKLAHSFHTQELPDFIFITEDMILINQRNSIQLANPNTGTIIKEVPTDRFGAFLEPYVTNTINAISIRNNKLYIWDIETGNLKQRLPIDIMGQIVALKISKNGEKLALIENNKHQTDTTIYDLIRKHKMLVLQNVDDAEFNEDGTKILTIVDNKIFINEFHHNTHKTFETSKPILTNSSFQQGMFALLYHDYSISLCNEFSLYGLLKRLNILQATLLVAKQEMPQLEIPNQLLWLSIPKKVRDLVAAKKIMLRPKIAK